jgi:O-antigen/teichoic acid export membrane protein
MGLRRRLASQSAIIFAVRIAGAGLIFLAQAAMARLWGVAVLGDYLLVFAAVNLIAVAMPFGFQTVAAYFAAEYRAQGQVRQLRRFLRRAYLHVGASAVLLAAFYFVIFTLPGSVAQTLAAYWPQLILLATTTGMVFVSGAALVGLKRPYAGFFADALFRPIVVLASLAIALAMSSGGEGLGQMLSILGVLYAVIGLVQAGYLVSTLTTVPDTQAPVPGQARRWWRFALPWAVITLATDFFFDLDLILLAPQLSREDLAIFGVCARIFALVAFGVSAVYAVTLPDVFEAEALKDRPGFMQKIGDANLVATGLAVLLFGGVAIGGPFALMLFGPAFQAGFVPLLVLCLSLVVRSAIGPASLVLSVNDRPYASLPAIGLGLFSLVLGNLALVPALGLVGAALAALLAITVWSVSLWATALRITGLDVSVFPRMRQLAARQRRPS